MRVACVVTIAVAGCYAPNPVEGLPCTEGGLCPEGLECGPDFTCVVHAIDAAVGADGPGAVDAPISAVDALSAIDAMPDGCPSCPAVVARYHFEGDLTDATGLHDGTAVGSGLTFVPAATAGEEAVHIPVAGTSWIRVTDAPAFDLTAGRVRLWFRTGGDTPPEDVGLASRDANGTVTDGHFSLRRGHDGRVVVRLQQMSNPTVQVYRCTAAPASAGVWHEVDVRFGPSGLTLQVDGIAATGTSWTDADGVARDCTTPWTGGIDGNDNPWVFGALTATSTEGTGAPVTAIAEDVALDDIRIESP